MHQKQLTFIKIWQITRKASKAADPGKLKANTYWYVWSWVLLIISVQFQDASGYIVHYVENWPDKDNDLFYVDTDYLTSLINKAPLKGLAFVADRIAETKNIMSHNNTLPNNEDKNGFAIIQQSKVVARILVVLVVLCNVSPWIATAEYIQKTLFYKQERSFTVFWLGYNLCFRSLDPIPFRARTGISLATGGYQFAVSTYWGSSDVQWSKKFFAYCNCSSLDYIGNNHCKIMAVGIGNTKWNKYHKDGDGKKPSYKKK